MNIHVYLMFSQSCYREVNVDISSLRRTKGSETYGEATIVLVRKILSVCDGNLANKTFVDLGSGCGQVCMMMAALSSAAMCFGIEKLDKPSLYAKKLLPRFIAKLNAERIRHAPVELMQGDFRIYQPNLENALRCAGLVFINNPKFEPSLNYLILQKLCPLIPKSTKVVCFESLIGTKGYWDNCLMYKSSIDCGPNSVTWHGHDVALHILEKL